MTLGQPLREWRYHDLRGVLTGSDNANSMSAAPWGLAISGMLTGGARFAYSQDGLNWTVWRDTTSQRHGLPRESFIRALATSATIAMAPHKRTIALAARYSRELSIVDLEAGTERRVALDDPEPAPASIRLARDSSVRITWREDARLHFVAAAPSRSFLALVDCDCRAGRADSTTERRQIWLVRWDGSVRARLTSPMAIAGIAVAEDEQSIVAAVQDGNWQRVVTWNLPSEALALNGRGTPVGSKENQSTHLTRQE